MLTEAKYDPNANNLLKSLLELTTNLNVTKILIEHGARATPELVLRLEDMESERNKHSLIKLMLTILMMQMRMATLLFILLAKLTALLLRTFYSVQPTVIQMSKAIVTKCHFN